MDEWWLDEDGPVKIVYIHQYFRTPRMAGGTRSYEFARRLVARGHQVAVVTADAGADSGRQGSWRRSIEDGIEVHWVAVPYDNAMRPWRRIVAFMHFLVAASRKPAKLPQDVVLATSTPLTVSIPGAWSSFRNRVPMVFEVRDLWPSVPIAMGVLRSGLSKRLARALEKWSYRQATSVIALSPDMVEGVRRVRPDVPVYMIPNASDRELFRRPSCAYSKLTTAFPWAVDRPIVLYAGTFGRANGVGYLIDVAAEFRLLNSRALVVLLGGGAEFEAVRERARQAGVLDENCFVLGSVPKEDVVAWYQVCTVAVSTFINIPELTANSPNKVFDALAAGRPVAINHGGWLGRVLQDSGAGLVLSADDPREAARTLAGFLADPDRMRLAGRAAEELARRSFDRDRLAREVEEVLIRAVSSKNP